MKKTTLIDMIAQDRSVTFAPCLLAVMELYPEMRFSESIGLTIQLLHRRSSRGVFDYCTNKKQLAEHIWHATCINFKGYDRDKIESISMKTRVANYDSFTSCVSQERFGQIAGVFTFHRDNQVRVC